jgi:hypothetical protein
MGRHGQSKQQAVDTSKQDCGYGEILVLVEEDTRFNSAGIMLHIHLHVWYTDTLVSSILTICVLLCQSYPQILFV